RASIRRFVERELRPHAEQWEDDRWFPDEVFGKLAAVGFLGLKYPERYGGEGGDYIHDAVFTEEITRAGSGGLAAGIGAHIGIATPPVFKFGTEEQKQRFLVPAIAGEKIAALGITEPDAGSDVAGLRTSAKKVDGGYVVNGSKTYITNGVRADFVVTAVKTTSEGGHHGISFLILEKGMDGYSVAKKLEKMGWHASDTAELAFADVFVPEENLLGEENKGFYLIMANFQWERLLMALGSVASMGLAVERTIEYAQQRSAFGRPIGKHQVIRHKIAEMALRYETGRALTYHALRLFYEGHDAIREVTEAKLKTQRDAFEVWDDALQVFGGAGYMKEYGIERAARDSRLGPIGGGTDEIMKEILGRQLGL
ncbi:MAG: acyl-CoA dehydrogenase family protein, partial [Thermoleophilaceae bacterium]|nr:acyl-CoA dehydrogenase family protein [Thermoleophilaceae bacterium]